MVGVIPAPAATVTFTNDTAITFFDTNYDGAEVVVSNCTLTLDGSHSFSNFLVAAGGTLTHTFSTGGIVTVLRSFTDEVQVLIGTNAVSLANTGAFVAASVTDLGKTVTYTNDQDYTLSFPGNALIQLQRTTNSAIPDGASVLVSYTVQVSTAAGLNLSVTGNVEVAVGGTIDVNRKGYGGNLGPGAGGEAPFSPISGGGAGHGGYGGMSSSNALGGTTYDSFTQPVGLGSGGGYGSSGSTAVGGGGGGAVRIVASGNLILDGVISATGADGTNSRSGGGSGGSIWLTAQTIMGAGALSVNGGIGEPIHGGGGGGGRIALEADTNNFTGLMTAYGGAGAKNGGAGTIYTKLTGQNGNLLVDNGGVTATNTPLQISNGADVTVRGRAVGAAINALILGKLLVGSNSMITANTPNNSLTINTTGDVTIEPSGRISADGLNTSGGLGAGTGSGSSCGGGGHGGYGGMGGSMFARGGTSFGSTISPQGFGGIGGGSGSSFPPFGGLGGGALRMSIGGKLVLNGSVSAEGKAGSGSYAGGGAGGSVWLTLTTWTGTGTISANGGPGILPGGGGGGGGRISISFATNSFSGMVTAYGGIGTNFGGAGTIYLKTNSQSIAQVTIDNGGNAGTNTMVDAISSFDLTILGKAIPQFVTSGWSVRNLRVGSNCTLAGTGISSPQTVSITASGDVIVDAGGAIAMDGQGYPGGQGTGAGYMSQSPRGGGGHGGIGGSNPTSTTMGSAYGSITSPATAGSGGGNGSGTSAAPFGGSGGGILNVNVTGKLTVNGRISSNGRNGDTESGGGAGGSVKITCGQLFGAGSISANGGNGTGNAGGGGGGRISFTYSSSGYQGTFSAIGGTGIVAGGAGTVYTKPQSANVGSVIIDNGGLAGTNTPLSATLGMPSVPFNLTISGAAGGMVLPPLTLLSNVTVGANSTLTIVSNQSNPTITVLKNLTIAAGGSVTVNGKGFGRGAGPGPGASLANKGAGGGYGAVGGASASGAPGGTNYGSSTQPVDRGSGGGAGANTFFGGSDGGGAVCLLVGDTLTVNGVLSANGNAGLQDDSGGGAGGSIWVVANTVSGSGVITANGGAGELFGGGGGAGGRIAIYSRTNTFAGVLSANGGAGATVGGNGSLFLSGLPVIQGTVTDTNGQPVAGVSVSVNLGNTSTTTGVDGKYEISLVPYSSFTVTPSFNGFLFVPGSRNYSSLSASLTNENYLMISSITPTVTGSLQNTNFVLNWFGIPGVTYQLYASTNLFDWLPYGAPIVGSNVVVGLTVPIDTDPSKFFRVRASN
jgi:Carboxypeptidase regulatory-like domain